jgi:hypothetical protein
MPLALEGKFSEVRGVARRNGLQQFLTTAVPKEPAREPISRPQPILYV